MRQLLTFLNEQSPLRLLFGVVILIIILSATSYAQTGIVAGIKSSYWDRYVQLGLIKNLSPTTAIYFSAEAGGGEYNFKPTAIYKIQMSKEITLGIIGGANVQMFKEDATDEEVLTYLSLATGIGLNVKLTKELSLFTTFDYTKNDAIENNTRFGAGAIFWFPLPNKK